MPVPKALVGKNMFKPPIEFCEFAHKYGVENVYFVDDADCKCSLRFENDIFIKITGAWGNYTKYPFSAKSYSEAAILRFLHEIGHAYHQHPGSLKDSNRLNINYKTDIWESLMGGNEGEAWRFALGFRKYNRTEYYDLISSYNDFLKSYKFRCPVAWEMNAGDELRRDNKVKGSGSLDNCPNWVVYLIENL